MIVPFRFVSLRFFQNLIISQRSMQPDSTQCTMRSLAHGKTAACKGERTDPCNHAEGNDTRPYGKVQYETERNGTARN